MVRIISIDEITKLDALIQIYVNHKEEDGVTSETVKKQMQSGLENKTIQIVVDENIQGIALGFLVSNLNADRISILFANWNYEVEQRLLDYTFKQLSKISSHISFESGYPTPWLSEELVLYASTLGFVKHDRAYMQLEPIDREKLESNPNKEKLEFIPFGNDMVDETSELVFRCVDGTIDQDLFPYIYSSVGCIKKFLNEVLSGVWGTHEPFYSWIIRVNMQNIGACFLLSREDTGFLIHIVIDPDYRQQGYGRTLLCHSFTSLLRIVPTIKKFELVVTLSNPAKLLYDSLGFRTLSASSTFVWKQ